METLIRRVSSAVAAGLVGGLVNSLLVWYLGKLGIPQKFGVAIAPSLTTQFLYPRLVWGALWGLLFALPPWQGGAWVSVFSRGTLMSLFPTAFQLLYVFPISAGKGMFGTGLGRLTPVFVCLYNVVWGLTAALWVHWAEGKTHN
ncbi:MAG: hypothetical protein GX443_04335 [Deltaproteobacteria bacterium]|nr:hypothetical protein [Deltaproteobacteria bacterium]